MTASQQASVLDMSLVGQGRRRWTSNEKDK